MLEEHLGVMVCLFLLLLLCLLDAFVISSILCDQTSFCEHIQYDFGLQLAFIIQIYFFSSHNIYLQNLFRPLCCTDLVFHLFLRPPDLY